VTLWRTIPFALPPIDRARLRGARLAGPPAPADTQPGCIDGEENTVNTRIEEALKASRNGGASGGKNRDNDHCVCCAGGRWRDQWLEFRTLENR
jgi:hypothetical protein